MGDPDWALFHYFKKVFLEIDMEQQWHMWRTLETQWSLWETPVACRQPG
jgi:hypothetical protein